MMARYRIGMVAACPLPFRRGTPVRVFRLAEALVSRGHDVHVITYHLGDRDVDAPFPIHRIPNVPGYRRTAPGPDVVKLMVLDPLLAWTLRRIVRRVGLFDVIHAHHVEGLLVARAAALLTRRAPIVFDAHTLLSAELPYYRMGSPRWVLRWLGAWFDRHVPRLADHVIPVSDRIRDELLRRGAVPPSTVTVAPNGVNVDRFLAHDDAATTVDPDLFVFTGNLAAYQGVDLLLRAMVRLRERRPGARLRIVTEDAADWPIAMARQLGVEQAVELVRVGFGAVPGELARARVGVSPRVNCDGVPQKVLNYMAAGKPTVAFAGSARHIVDGVTGRVVPDGDTDALAHAIADLLDAPEMAEAMGQRARELVKRDLSWAHAAAQIEQVYARLVREPEAASVSSPPLPQRGAAAQAGSTSAERSA